MSYRIKFSKQAQKDLQKIKQDGTLAKRVLILLEILELNPFQNPPAYEKLQGELKNAYSRRINSKHRIVYRVENNDVLIMALWSHYDNV